MSNKSVAILKEKDFSGLSENSSVLEQAGNAAANDAVPIDDIRGSAKYRRDILKVLTQRAIIKAIAFAKNTQ
jgi:carbon-monoxide dehydrogenase medium subunit